MITTLSGVAMPRGAVVPVENLDRGAVLAPERYDPLRRLPSLEGVPLTDLCTIVRETISAKGGGQDKARGFHVLDTSSAREGFLTIERAAVPRRQIGSLKKRAESRDVLISRLRPYLRQVAYVDDLAVDWTEAQLACSTEFYVLRSLTNESIAFLVPYLLSPSVQSVLAASQEGGHHPRVNEDTIRSLRIPSDRIHKRQEISARMIRAARSFREATRAIEELILQAGAE
jgi:hypothetical protein